MSTKLDPSEPMAMAHGNELRPQYSGQLGEVQTHDAVFGEITERGPNYRNVRCACIYVSTYTCSILLMT